MKTIMEKVALVTGSSSGIGFETSLALARNGFHTFATIRKKRLIKIMRLYEIKRDHISFINDDQT